MQWRWLATIAAAALLFRCIGAPGTFLELDSVIYARAAEDWARVFSSGTMPSFPLRNQVVTAIEYWPPLFPFLSGTVHWMTGVDALLVGRLLSLLAGWLTIFPAWYVGRRFFEPRAGLLCAAFVGFAPWLVWLGRIPRTEAVYHLLLGMALAFAAASAWRPGRGSGWMGALGGASMALACMTRFEAVASFGCLVLACMLLARAQQGEERRRAWWTVPCMLVGFAVTIGPYWIDLAMLNDGRPTIAPPQKKYYDFMESETVFSNSNAARMVSDFGPPGVPHDDGTALRQWYLSHTSTNASALVSRGMREAPLEMLSAFRVCPPLALALALLAFWRGRRDARLQALALMLLPLSAIVVTTWWDPDPRYYTFMVLPLMIAASRGALLLWDGEVRLRPTGWTMLRALVLPALVFSAWYAPGTAHFGIRSYNDELGPLLQDDPGKATRAVLAIGVVSGGLMIVRRLPLPGLVVAAAGAAALMAYVRRPAAYDVGLLGWWPALSLGVLVLALAAWYVRLGRRTDPHAVLLAAALFSAVTALNDNVSMLVADAGMARMSHSAEVAAWLRAHPTTKAVTGDAMVDTVSAGQRWKYMPMTAEEWAREGPSIDVCVMQMDEARPRGLPQNAERFVRLEQAAKFPMRPGLTWVVYFVRKNF